MFTKEAPRETPEDESKLMAQKARFDNFTFTEESVFLNI